MKTFNVTIELEIFETTVKAKNKTEAKQKAIAKPKKLSDVIIRMQEITLTILPIITLNFFPYTSAITPVGNSKSTPVI